MKNIKSRLARYSIDTIIYFSAVKLVNIPRFLSTYISFKSQATKDSRFSVKFSDLKACLTDNTVKTAFDPHYTYHPAWAARIVATIQPKKHIDISSILHFSTLVSAFVPVEFYDYRPAEVILDNLKCLGGDLNKLPFKDNSVESLSCMHTIEHIGLGRYGDVIDPQGDIKATRELARVLRLGGNLIFVTPVGKPRIQFNAHRIYSYQNVLDLFPSLTLKEFSMVPDDYKTHGLIRNADSKIVANQEYACGCFWFTKK